MSLLTHSRVIHTLQTLMMMMIHINGPLGQATKYKKGDAIEDKTHHKVDRRSSFVLFIFGVSELLLLLLYCQLSSIISIDSYTYIYKCNCRCPIVGRFPFISYLVISYDDDYTFYIFVIENFNSLTNINLYIDM